MAVSPHECVGGSSRQPRLLFVDAHDSFSENIAAMLLQILDVDVTLITIDDPHAISASYATPEEGRFTNSASSSLYIEQFDAIVIGPGPGNPSNPSDIGIIPQLLSLARESLIPVLGICLGFQYLCTAYGLTVHSLPIPSHGQVKQICHMDEDIFTDLGPFEATTYNSLGMWLSALLTDKPEDYEFRHSIARLDMVNTTHDLLPLAWDNEGWLMAVKHKRLPFWGLQYHPESCKSSRTACQDMIVNWWKAVRTWNNEVRTAVITARQIPAPHPDKTQKQPSRPVHTTLSETNRAARRPLRWESNDEAVISQLIDRFPSRSQIETRCMKLNCSPGELARYCHLQLKAAVMLESARKDLYSIIALPNPDDLRLTFDGTKLTLKAKGFTCDAMTGTTNFFEILETVLSRSRISDGPEHLPFWGGLIGFFSYELGLKLIGNLPPGSSQQSLVPDASLVWTDRSIVVDHMNREVYVQSIRHDDSEWLETTCEGLQAFMDSSKKQPSSHMPSDAQLHDKISKSEPKFSLPYKQDYLAKIENCFHQLHAGNTYELCLTTEAQVDLTDVDPWRLYESLKRCNPAPFNAFLDLEDCKIVSSSPEQFLKWDRSGVIDMVPMKGTVAKYPDMTLARAREILSSPKESAENLMITDLIRHDLYHALGRDARVEVVKLCDVVEHETVYQLVSHVQAKPDESSKTIPNEDLQSVSHKRGLRALRHSLPPGSMTGAPKKRSCGILSDLEQRDRGVYSGVLGFLDVGGAGSFSVCIRTAFSTEQDVQTGTQDQEETRTWHIGAGGAITVLSDPGAEWEEMTTKLNSVLRGFTGIE